jgi:NADH-quinone oxidoreductase subunit N
MTPKTAPEIDFAAISPLIALAVGACVVLMSGLLRSRFARTQVVPALTIGILLTTAGLAIWQWGENTSVISGALRMDDLTGVLILLFAASGIATVLLAWRAVAPRDAGHGEFYALLLSCILGMVILVASENLVAVFIGYELLSIPLYVLCATELRRERSLESGLKYLIIGSVGSATLLYGLAMLYGAAGSTDFTRIADAVRGGVGDDTLFLTGIALTVTGLAFKASIAPFHQWTPDVYEGAPTPVTAFMAVATKAAAFGVFLRLFDVALIGSASIWAPALAVLAAATIVIGNVGALGQSSLKRLLAYSSVAQAGYMLAGVVVSTRLGVQATVFYLAVYMIMNLAAFAVIVVRERETDLGDDISALHGIGENRPWLAWPMTIAMLSLAGFPVTAGFFGKINLIQAVVDNDYAWLGVVIVLGSALSLAYYLRVVAAVWMRSPGDAIAAAGARLATPGGRPLIAGGSPEADGGDDEEDDRTGARPAGDAGAGAQRPAGDAGAGGQRPAGAGDPEGQPDPSHARRGGPDAARGPGPRPGGRRRPRPAPRALGRGGRARRALCGGDHLLRRLSLAAARPRRRRRRRAHEPAVGLRRADGRTGEWADRRRADGRTAEGRTANGRTRTARTVDGQTANGGRYDGGRPNGVG